MKFKSGDWVRLKSVVKNGRLYDSGMIGVIFVLDESGGGTGIFDWSAKPTRLIMSPPERYLREEDIELDAVYASSLMKALRDE